MPRSADLFSPLTLRSVTVPNRIVKSAMAEGACTPDGLPTPLLARQYARWARGGVGLCITGIAGVQPGHGFTEHEIGLYSDAAVEPLRAVTSAVHEAGGKIVAQLNYADPQIPRARARRQGARAPHAGFSWTHFGWNRQITGSELLDLAKAFGDAAARARRAGFDGVQLHAAHGYLLSRLLSPRHNRRTDAWGGTFERRTAFLRDCVGAVRQALGPDLPVLVKLNATDGTPGRGLELPEALRIGELLEGLGVDALEVSAGTADVGMGCYPNKGELPLDLGRDYLGREFPFLRPVLPFLPAITRFVEPAVRMEHEAYFAPLAEAFAERLSIPVICVGGIRSRETAERLLQRGVAMVALARPLVRQPHLPRLWAGGREPKAQCTSCNRCFVQLGLGHPLRCWHVPAEA